MEKRIEQFRIDLRLTRKQYNFLRRDAFKRRTTMTALLRDLVQNAMEPKGTFIVPERLSKEEVEQL